MPMLPEGTLISALIGGAISKVINDGVDYPKSKIKRVIKDRHDQNISTKIFRVIESALNIVTDNIYKNSDDLYDAIEKIFIEFKNHNNTLESVKSGLNVLGADTSEQRCENFLENFYDGICKDNDLYKRINLFLKEQDIVLNQEGIEGLNKKIENNHTELSKKVDSIFEILNGSNINNEKEIVDKNNKFQNILEKDTMNKVEFNIHDGGQVIIAKDNAEVSAAQYNGNENRKLRQSIKSRTQEYADKWNQNMFLNDFDKRDENAGVNVKLSEVYSDEQLPHYIWDNNKRTRNDLKDLLKEYIYPHNDNKMLLILGQPGIGKSTLITWITANFIDRIDNILVYKFASDLKSVDWNSDILVNTILDQLGFEYKDLNEKILVLDGLDEVNIKNREQVLEYLNVNLMDKRNIYKFSLIITCRENYIEELYRIKSDYIILQPWDEKQIENFYKVFQKKTNSDIYESTIKRLVENKEILGIPLILYMVVALNIFIERDSYIVDIYDKIFSLKEASIYDRCIYGELHRIGKIKEQIHQISRNIAIWMFENKPQEACISRENYEQCCDNVMGEVVYNDQGIKQDVMIGTYFKKIKHCEGIETDNIYFVHRSIYEYFVAETIYSSIESAMIHLTDESQEQLAKYIAFYLKKGSITKVIGEYLQYKILTLYNKLEDTKKVKFYKWWECSVNKMIKKGMFYYTNKIYSYGNIVEFELNCFNNLLKILRLLMTTGDIIYILQEAEKEKLKKYIQYGYIERENKREPAEFSNISLKNIYLSKTNLRNAILICTDLSNAVLEEVDLRRAILIDTNLSGANLREADLRETNLENSNLTNTILSKANLYKANFHETILYNTIFLYADLRRADLRKINLREVDLRGAYLTASIWYKHDIQKILQQLKYTFFEYINVEDEKGIKSLYRNEFLFD